MRILLFAALLAGYSVLAADFRLDAGAVVSGGTLLVEPQVHGAAGANLRYEIRTTREGSGGTSSSSQSGNVRIGEQGSAKLARTSVSVSPRDRYRVEVKVFEGGRVVAQEVVRYPD